MKCFFVSDLHGDVGKYNRLFKQIHIEKPDLVFLGGDLLTGGYVHSTLHIEDTLHSVLAAGFETLREELRHEYPMVVVIMGNDDPRSEENSFIAYEKQRLWVYANQKHFHHNGIDIYGYGWVPPSPFLNKDWERYDVSRFVDVGCVSPEEGYRSAKISFVDIQNRTIKDDLTDMTSGHSLSSSIFLFHAPPYNTGLDRAALDGKTIDYVPLDVHVGSIAIRRFIEKEQPLVTLHGHIHESYKLTGIWKEKIGDTICMSAVGTGRKLVLIKFDTDNPDAAQRMEI